MKTARARKETGLESIRKVSTAMEFDGTIDGTARLIKAPLESMPDARRRIVELLRGEEDMVKFVKVADKMFRGTKHIPGKGDTPSLDIICERCGINRSLVYGAIARRLHHFHFEVAEIAVSAVLSSRAAEIAESMADNAALPTGHADRRLAMEVMGMKQRGGGVNVSVNNTATAQAATKTEMVSEETGRVMPSFEDGIKNMAARLRAIPARAEEVR